MFVAQASSISIFSWTYRVPPFSSLDYMIHHYDQSLENILNPFALFPLVSNLRPTGHRQLRMAMNLAQHKIINLLNTLWDFFVIMCHNVFNVRPKQLFFFQCGPETPKGWTPLVYMIVNLMCQFDGTKVPSYLIKCYSRCVCAGVSEWG